MIIGRKKEIEMLRDAYESELPRHIIHLSGRHYHHLIISVSSAYNPCSFHLWVFYRTRILRIDADALLGERFSPPAKIRWIRIIRVRFISSEFFFEHRFYGLTRMLRSVSDYHHLIKSGGFVKSVFVLPPCFFSNTDLSDWRGCFARWEVLSSRQQFSPWL